MRNHKTLASIAELVHRERIQSQAEKCSSCGDSWNVKRVGGQLLCQICREKFTELGNGILEPDMEEAIDDCGD